MVDWLRDEFDRLVSGGGAAGRLCWRSLRKTAIDGAGSRAEGVRSRLASRQRTGRERMRKMVRGAGLKRLKRMAGLVMLVRAVQLMEVANVFQHASKRGGRNVVNVSFPACGLYTR